MAFSARSAGGVGAPVEGEGQAVPVHDCELSEQGAIPCGSVVKVLYWSTSHFPALEVEEGPGYDAEAAWIPKGPSEVAGADLCVVYSEGDDSEASFFVVSEDGAGGETLGKSATLPGDVGEAFVKVLNIAHREGCEAEGVGDSRLDAFVDGV